jgi:uncharacterized protein (DUF924 family)
MLTRLACQTAPHILRPQLHLGRAMSTFELDKTIFNPTLYKELTDVWLGGVDLKGEELPDEALKRWFRGTPDEQIVFDALCRAKFAPALESIGPDKMPKSTAQPFVDEIQEVARNDSCGNGSQAAWTALSLTILLDQIPRNIYRTGTGLRNVYVHYDTLSYALIRALFSPSSPIPRPNQHLQWRHSFAHVLWFHLPLVHSENIEAHDLLDGIQREFAQDMEKSEGLKASKFFLGPAMEEEAKHRAILERFGRYPHRNQAVGRQSTEEERKFLDEGGDTFGVAQTK